VAAGWPLGFSHDVSYQDDGGQNEHVPDLRRPLSRDGQLIVD
jgi:hypothetical protein